MNQVKITASRKINILVAEDEGIIAINLKNILLKNGYDVAGPVRTGEEVISAVHSTRPDLILMDVMLEGKLSGIQAAEKIKKFSIPIIYITALNDDETFLNAYKSNPYEYIVKPFVETKLLSSIKFALNSKS